MANNNDDKSKKNIKMYQWLYITPFSVLGGLGVLAVALVALFVFICSAKYLVVSFTLESVKIFPALTLTFIGFCIVAALVFSEVLLIKKYIKALKEFNKEKKDVLSDSSK